MAWIHSIFRVVGEIGLSGLLDISFMALLMYTLLVWTRRTRSAFILTGILIVAGIYLVSRQMNLILTSRILESFFAVILIALVIIFQEELRYFFEQIAVWSLNRRILGGKETRLSRKEVDILVRTLKDLARDRIGALVVLRGRDLLVRHLTGGTDLDGKLSEPLLKSLFDPHSIGHDGAVIIEKDRVVQFSCHLPLSKNLEKLGKGGTRHAAALGLAEHCDALCLVVSEERGTISVARNGDLTTTPDAETLISILESFYEEMDPVKRLAHREEFLKRNWREKTIAVIMALLLWFVLVYGSRQTYRTYQVPVSTARLPGMLAVQEMNPPYVYVTLSGPRNAFYFLDTSELRLFLRNISAEEGMQELQVYPADLEVPKHLSLEVMTPQRIQIEVGRREFVQSESREIARTMKDLLRGDGWAAAPRADESTPDENAKAIRVQRVKELERARPDEVVRYLQEKQMTTSREN